LLGVACAGDTGSSTFSDHILTAVEELQIGSVDDPVTALTWFRALEVAPDGSIYTLHRQEHAIRVHDSTGAFVRTIGREGEGPGEFDSPGTMGMLGDTLWVLDYGTYRFSYFSLTGEFLGSQQIPIDLGNDPTASPPRPRGLLSDGSISGSSPVWSHLAASGEIETSAILRLDSTSSVLDTIATYSVENTTWEVTDPDNPRSMRSYQPQPFSDTDIVMVAARVPLVVSVGRRVPESPESADFSVTSVDFTGDTVFAREFSYTPVPIEQTLVDSLVETRAAGVADSPFPSAPTADRAVVWARNTLYTPAFHPPVSQLVIGRDGSLWLSAERVGGPTVSWRIISPQGDAVGSVELAARFTPLLVDGNRVWGSWYDELDVPYILRYWVGLPSDAPDRIRLGG
jgi:hypothetical protein